MQTRIETQRETQRDFLGSVEQLRIIEPNHPELRNIANMPLEKLGPYLIKHKESFKNLLESLKTKPDERDDDESENELDLMSDSDDENLTRNQRIQNVEDALANYLAAEREQQLVEEEIKLHIERRTQQTNLLLDRTNTLLLALRTGSEIAKRHLDDQAYQNALEKIAAEKDELEDLRTYNETRTTIAANQAALIAKIAELDALRDEVIRTRTYKTDNDANQIKTYGTKTERINYDRGGDEAAGYHTSVEAWVNPAGHPRPFGALGGEGGDVTDRPDKMALNQYDKTTINNLAIFTERKDTTKKPRSEIAQILDRSINPIAIFSDVCNIHSMTTWAKLRRLGAPYPALTEDMFKTLLDSMQRYNDPLNEDNLMKHSSIVGMGDAIDNVLASALMTEYRNKMTVTFEGQDLPAKNIVLLVMKQVESFLTLYGPDMRITIEDGWSREYVQAVLLYCTSKNYPVINRTNHAIPEKDYKDIPMALLSGELGSKTQTNFLKYIESDDALRQENNEASAAQAARERAKTELFGNDSVIRRPQV